MELNSISCGNCGAPLRVPAEARFVTCNHCQSHLAVKHSDSVTWTEKLGELDERTERLEDELSELRYETALQRLDREWERERETYMITSKNGRRHVPTVGGAIFGGVFAGGMGLFFMIMMAGSRGGGGAMGLFGLVFIAVGIGIAIHSYVKAQDYLAAESRYRRRRAQLRSKKGVL